MFSRAAAGAAGGSCRLPNPSDRCCCVMWGDLPGYVASKPGFSGLPGNFFLEIIFYFPITVTYNILPGNL